ncbi:MAG: hypothetical protein WC089_03305 [Candidatus Paceibacterota bacterium]
MRIITKHIPILIATFALMGYLFVSMFGLLQFDRTAGVMMDNCPYTQNNYSICENVFDHINNWQQFSNVIIPASFLSVLLAFVIIFFFINRKDFLQQVLRLFYRWKYYLYNKKFNTRLYKVIKWLSLFENSPSLATVRHTRAFS